MNKQNRILIGLIITTLLISGVCLFTAFTGLTTYFSVNRSLTFDNIFPNISQPQVEMQDLPQTSLSSDLDLGYLFKPFWESRQFLHDDYVDQPVDDQVLANGAVEGLRETLAAYDIDLDKLIASADAPSAVTLATSAKTPEETGQIFTPFWNAWQAATYSDLNDDELTYEKLMQGSLGGMVAALGDPHTSYLDPETFRQTQIDLEGEYEGIGAYVDTSTEYLTIVSPMEGSPAEKAGLLPGDRIIAIDGEDMTGIPGDLVILRVLGPAGSEVLLKIERDGLDEPFDVKLTRAHIVVPTVKSEMLEGNIAYIQLYNFGADSYEQIHSALKDALSKNPKGLILDLRNNGGGYLYTAVNITSEFIGDGVLVYEEDGKGNRDTHNANHGGIATEIPLVVLVNQGTASASEILAGAVQDYDRGLIVGMTTYGKGSVQLPITLSNDQGALRITIAKWLTPNGRHIQGVGIQPDEVVDYTEADFKAGVDPQLDLAIEILSSS
jgi:carboxyl-terminal processing protease